MKRIYAIRRWNYFPAGLWLTISIPSARSHSPSLSPSPPSLVLELVLSIVTVYSTQRSRQQTNQLKDSCPLSPRSEIDYLPGLTNHFSHCVCGSSWTLCSSHGNRSPVWGWIQAASPWLEKHTEKGLFGIRKFVCLEKTTFLTLFVWSHVFFFVFFFLHFNVRQEWNKEWTSQRRISAFIFQSTVDSFKAGRSKGHKSTVTFAKKQLGNVQAPRLLLWKFLHL